MVSRPPPGLAFPSVYVEGCESGIVLTGSSGCAEPDVLHARDEDALRRRQDVMRW